MIATASVNVEWCEVCDRLGQNDRLPLLVLMLSHVLSCQVYDRLGQNDVTVEVLSQEFGAVYSVAAVDAVLSSSAQYDGLRLVIYVRWP